MNIENLPYAERKFLVVVREPTLTDKILDYGTWVLVPTALVRLGWKVYETVQQRHLPAMIQAMTGDVNTLVFPPGHPQIDTVYTAHPDADSPLYWVTATFHRRLFEARVAEFARIMRCAGATKLAINAERKTESEAEAMAKLHVAMASVDPRVRVRRTSSTRLSISFRGGQGEATELPSDLLFFKHEPTWREIYYSAVSAGIESCDVEVATSDDFGLDAKIAGEFVKLGFNIGGNYENHVNHRLKAQVHFR